MANDDDLYERYAKGAVDAAGRKGFMLGYELGLKHGEERGLAAGLKVGEESGFYRGVAATRAALRRAIADGTRHGSPECARTLESMKRWDDDSNEE